MWIKVGDKVRVVSKQLEPSMVGIEGTVVRFSKPHGFAVLAETNRSGGEVLVHPEACERIGA